MVDVVFIKYENKFLCRKFYVEQSRFQLTIPKQGKS